MAEAVVSFTVERLGELLISEAKLLYGVDTQIEDIRSQLTRMQCYLQDADVKQHQNHTIKNWVREIRALSYKTEDVIETFAAEAASKRRGGAIKIAMRSMACLLCHTVNLHKIGLELEDIKAKMAELTTNLQTCAQITALNGGETSNSLTSETVRMTYSHLTHTDFDFVGMRDEVTDLVSHLKTKDRGCQVISVWGMGGLGKTTLVRQVYHHDDIHSFFQAFAWVSIGQRFQKEKVLQDLLIQLLPEKTDEVKVMGDRELVRLLHMTQLENNCFIVLDDVWTVAAWKSLEPAFPIGNQASTSKVVLTTRIHDVAKQGIVHKLRRLSEEESWQLFSKVLSRKEDDNPESRVSIEKVDIGKEMVGKCEGLPLAICALGGILRHKLKLNDWKLIRKDVASYISRGEKVEDEVHVVTHILALSYDTLSYRLKQLLLYFAHFPEDQEISTVQLYRLWITDGLIIRDDKKKGETLMDVAERYLIELADRSLVEIIDKKSLHWTKCSVHDLIRDLCLLKGKDEDFVNIVDSRDNFSATLHSSSLTQHNVTHSRRLAIHLYDGMDPQFLPLNQQNVFRQLRSLILFNPNRVLPLKADNLRKFKLLRVLSLDNFDLNSGNVVEGIGELTYLRYLSLRYCIFDELPTSIGNLRLLQSLDLRVKGEISIPNNVLCRMKQLKHLFLPLKFRLKDASKKLRLDGPSELENLYGFDVGTCDLNDLVKLTSVRVLRDVTVRSVEDVAKTINFINSELHNKQYLSLYCLEILNLGSEEGLSCLIQAFQCAALNSLLINGHVGTLPKHDNPRLFSQRLTRIVLWKCEFEEDPMILLENLPNLIRLRLYYKCFTGKEVVCASMGFPKLTLLEIDGLPNLETWKVEEGAMSNLSELQIWNCDRLKMLPDGLRYIDSLKKLNLQKMAQEFKDRVKVINGVQGEDFDKICHVRSIML